jgi:hypothetical protein
VTETVTIRARPVFWFGISSSTFPHDENIGAGPEDSVFFVEIPWTRQPVKSLDTVPHWTGIQHLVVYETPQWQGHLTEPVQAGYKVLWKGIYRLERKYGRLSKLEKLSDSTDTAFINFRPEL